MRPARQPRRSDAGLLAFLSRVNQDICILRDDLFLVRLGDVGVVEVPPLLRVLIPTCGGVVPKSHLAAMVDNRSQTVRVPTGQRLQIVLERAVDMRGYLLEGPGEMVPAEALQVHDEYPRRVPELHCFVRHPERLAVFAVDLILLGELLCFRELLHALIEANALGGPMFFLTFF